ncbi:MAG: alpha/beta fold hydrolase [Vicinamibacterales bacterium]
MDLSVGRMHYVDEGRGEPILFVHGTPTWSFEWRHLIRAFAPTHRCIAPDHIGFGLSDRPRNFAYTPDAHADNLAQFVERLNPEPLTLVVHDYGGPIGLPLCLRHPERVRRLVLVNTWMWSFAGDRDMESRGRIAGGRLGRFLYRWANFSLRVLTPYAYGDKRKLTPEIHRQYLDRFADRWARGAVLWPLAHAILGSSGYYDSLWRERDKLLGRPALIVWGMKDPAFGAQQLARWRETLPSARVVEIDAGHWPHEESPDSVADAMREFLLTR